MMEAKKREHECIFARRSMKKAAARITIMENLRHTYLSAITCIINSATSRYYYLPPIFVKILSSAQLLVAPETVKNNDFK